MLALIREKEGGYKRVYDCHLFMTRWIASTVHPSSMPVSVQCTGLLFPHMLPASVHCTLLNVL